MADLFPLVSSRVPSNKKARTLRQRFYSRWLLSHLEQRHPYLDYTHIVTGHLICIRSDATYRQHSFLNHYLWGNICLLLAQTGRGFVFCLIFYDIFHLEFTRRKNHAWDIREKHLMAPFSFLLWRRTWAILSRMSLYIHTVYYFPIH